jgi:aminopeptidase N
VSGHEKEHKMDNPKMVAAAIAVALEADAALVDAEGFWVLAFRRQAAREALRANDAEALVESLERARNTACGAVYRLTNEVTALRAERDTLRAERDTLRDGMARLLDTTGGAK